MKVVAARGQILILVLLIVVVALAVGLSVAARNITNLRTSAQTEQSQRAFSAAEGGVEDTLSKLSTFQNVPVAGQTVDVPVGNLTANVTVKSSTTYQSTIDLGSVGQINLAGMAAGSAVNIEWGKNQNCSSGASAPFVSTIAVTQYASDGTQLRNVYQGCAFASGRDETGPFNTPSGCSGADGFMKCTQITTIPGAALMRIRPFWEPTAVRVSGATIPVQMYDITSTAQVVPAGSNPSTTGGVTRTVRVQRAALPQLPAAFDYVLFSNGGIAKGGS